MIPNFAELCLMLYVTIDDHYRALPVALKPRGEQAACSDSELLTMLVVSECMGWQRETEHVSQWARHRDLFPRQPDRTRLNRRRRALIATLTALRGRVLATLDLACRRRMSSRPDAGGKVGHLSQLLPPRLPRVRSFPACATTAP